MTDTEAATLSSRAHSGPVRPAEARTQGAKIHAPTPALVEFRVLGPVEAVVGGLPVDLGAPKQRMLLTLLISRIGQPVSVDAILEELWAGMPPPSAVTSLQAYVANLRRALEPARLPRAASKVLRTGGCGYLLNASVAEVDVQRFERLAAAGRRAWELGDAQQALSDFESALALWRGQAYAEMPSTSQVLPHAARLEELRLSVVEGRCAALLAVGAHEVAVAELEAFVQAYPLREYGCELLSLALYRAGRQADALAALRTNQKRLAEQLGIDPRPALQNLEREILNHAPELEWRPAAPVTPPSPQPRPLPPAPGAPPPGPALETALFVGRDRELLELSEALASAAAGHGRVVMVSGEPAVGKTSLLRRFAELAQAPVLWGACPEHLATPRLWPWQQVLRAAVERRPGRPVPAPVAELLDRDADPCANAAEAAPAVMMRWGEAIINYLIEGSCETPLVIVLDHLHRADPGSIRLLAHLTEWVPVSHLMVAASYQSGEAAAAEISAVLARAQPTRIELAGLDVQDTSALAQAMLHREVSRSAAQALRDRTEGNPFFLRELIRTADSEGRLDRLHTAPVPVPVREVVLRSVARLPQAAADLLVVASVAGRRFSLDIVAEAASVDDETALRLVETVVAAGLVLEDPQRLGWFRFTHALAAEVLCETVGRLRRALLLRRIDAAAVRAAGAGHGGARERRRWLFEA